MEPAEKRTKKDMTGPAEELSDLTKGKARLDIFTIPLVTDCIFNHLEYSDLLSCSLVSQAWRSQARDFQRRQRTSLLKCKIEDQADSLQQLLDHLSDDNNNLRFRQLFTGVHVWIEGIEAKNFEVEDPNDPRNSLTPKTQPMLLIEDWQRTRNTQLTKLFGLFPMKHLIVTFKGYRFDDLPVVFFALEFIFPLLPDCQLETLRITGLEMLRKYSAKFLWNNLPIKGSPKLKTVKMDGQDYKLPLETTPLVWHRKWREISNQVLKDRICKEEEDDRRMEFIRELTERRNLLLKRNKRKKNDVPKQK